MVRGNNMLKKIKQAVPNSIKRVIKNSNINIKNSDKIQNNNLIITEIIVNIDDVLLKIKTNQLFKIKRLGVLVSAEKKIYDIPFKYVDNQIILNKKDLQSFSVLGKHVFRVFYDHDQVAHSLKLVEKKLNQKYIVFTESSLNNVNFLYFYRNVNENLTLALSSKNERKTAPKYIQGYLDGQQALVQKNQALFEANHGKTNSGNMFSLAIELASRDNFEVYWVSKKPDSAKKMFEFYGAVNIKIIQHLSYEYGNILSTSQLLFSDNTFYPFFSKRKDQKYINTWHGTPLKTLGKDIKGEETSFGNIVKNMLQVDNLYFSNKHTAQRHLSSLDLDGTLNTNVYIAPSPRNSSFFKTTSLKNIKKYEKIENKKIIVYLPTYRGKSSDANTENSEKIQKLFNDFVSILPDDFVLYYKLHPIDNQNLNVSLDENRIRKIPEEYELYDFLSVTDGLITDYSSIMFDYALLNKPIYLYTYDEEEYFSERGTYLDINDLPFSKFSDATPLVKKLLKSKEQGRNISEFINQFAPYDNENGAKEIIDHVLYGEGSPFIEKYENYNGKPNVYIMGGSLWANGVTAALKNVIDNVDLNKRNYILLVDSNNFKQADIGRYLFFDERIKVYPFKGFAIRSDFEDLIVKKYESGESLLPLEEVYLEKAFEREIGRIFGNNSPDYFIHFSGYEVKFAEFVIFMKNTKTMMYVHNDMFKEYSTRKNFNPNVIFDSYRKADKVVLVNDELKSDFIRHFPDLSKKVTVANNFIGYKNILKIENEPFEEILLENSFHYSIASQGQGNPLSALKERILNGVKNNETRFLKINKVYEELDQSISGIVRNPYLHITNDLALKQLLIKKYLVKEYSSFLSQFGDVDGINKLLVELLFPKALKEFRVDILPKTTQRQLLLYDTIIHKKPDQVNNELDPIENIYNIYGLRKLEVIEELYDENITIFINIARFDQQKRLDRLILAFEKIYQSDSNTRLYIVASHGKEKEALIKLTKNSIANSAIRIFGAMNNPYPLLKKADSFVFTSDYEALGLVVYEALAVGLPVITTNLSTTMKNLDDTQVDPVELSVDGVYLGMKRFLSGKYPNKKFDFESYELKAQREFEEVFNFKNLSSDKREGRV
ncbi:glycosyltransferase [Leuconostoc carnosum]|nr:glycosyltransferase [Leuconostoc carnosum]